MTGADRGLRARGAASEVVLAPPSGKRASTVVARTGWWFYAPMGPLSEPREAKDGKVLKHEGRDADDKPMTRFGDPRPVPRPALAVATASSCMVILAGAAGVLGAPVVVGALGAAALGAVLSARGARPAEPRLLAPLPMGVPSSRAAVAAPRAGDLAATGQAVHTDAA